MIYIKRFMWVFTMLTLISASIFGFTYMFAVTNENYGLQGMAILGFIVLAILVVIDVQVDEYLKRKHLIARKKFEKDLMNMQAELNQHLKEMKRNDDAV